MPSSDSIFIRQAERTELQTLQEIGRATFAEAFAAQNAASDMANYLNENFSLGNDEQTDLLMKLNI